MKTPSRVRRSPIAGHPRGARRQRGQALTEMAILAVVVVPLFLLIPVLAKYIHGRQVMQQAVRAAAWEATVAPDYEIRGSLDAAQQTRNLIHRHFNDANAPIRSQLPEEADDAPLGNPMFNSFSGLALVERADISLGEYTHELPTGVLSRVADLIPSAIPGNFPPSDAAGRVNGLVSASLSVRYQNLRTRDGGPASYLAPFDALDIEMSSGHTILTDTWNARGSGVRNSPSQGHHRSTFNQVRTLAPLGNLAELDDIVRRFDPISWVPVFGALTRLRFGIAQDMMDIVPEDRLEPYNP